MGRDSSCMQAVAIGLIFRTVPFCITGDFIWPTRSPEHFWRRIESRDSLGNHYFFKQCTELMFMWCTTPPLHNFSTFPNREIQRSFKHTVAFFFSIWQRCWNAGVVCGLPVSWYWPQGHHKFFPGVFGTWNYCFCLFTGSVLLCTILFKLKICLFAFCFVFSFVYCSIAFPFLLFSGFNTGCAL